MATVSDWLATIPERMPAKPRKPRKRNPTDHRVGRPGDICRNPACERDCNGQRYAGGYCAACTSYRRYHQMDRPWHLAHRGPLFRRRSPRAARSQPAGTFGPLLFRARCAADLSIDELAGAVGITGGYISRIERGERNPPRRPVVERLALILNLDAAATDRLLLAAGLAPAHLLEVAEWQPRG
jgi:hypothetical protein